MEILVKKLRMVLPSPGSNEQECEPYLATIDYPKNRITKRDIKTNKIISIKMYNEPCEPLEGRWAWSNQINK